MRHEIENYLAQNSGEQAADPLFVAETFPYVLRQIPVPRYPINGQVRMEPQSDLMDIYGVPFWTHRTRPTSSPSPYILTFVLETSDLFERVRTVNPELTSQGVMILSSNFYNSYYEKLRSERRLPEIPTTAEHFALGRKISKDYMLLDLEIVRTGSHPILTVPVPLTLSTADVASSI